MGSLGSGGTRRGELTSDGTELPPANARRLVHSGPCFFRRGMMASPCGTSRCSAIPTRVFHVHGANKMASWFRCQGSAVPGSRGRRRGPCTRPRTPRPCRDGSLVPGGSWRILWVSYTDRHGICGTKTVLFLHSQRAHVVSASLVFISLDLQHGGEWGRRGGTSALLPTLGEHLISHH